jgi:hypothetical protein
MVIRNAAGSLRQVESERSLSTVPLRLLPRPDGQHHWGWSAVLREPFERQGRRRGMRSAVLAAVGVAPTLARTPWSVHDALVQ